MCYSTYDLIGSQMTHSDYGSKMTANHIQSMIDKNSHAAVHRVIYTYPTLLMQFYSVC